MDAIEKYFSAEKTESAVFIAIGILAIAISVYFLFKIKTSYFNGIAFALMGIALIQLTVGTSVYLRSPKDIKRVQLLVQNDIESIETEEIPRMEVVMKNFVIYRWVEIVLIVFGMFLFFYNQPQNLWKGIGLGLMIQASIMLFLDYFAESRGKNYLEYLKTFL
jgi:hypothetical protein